MPESIASTSWWISNGGPPSRELKPIWQGKAATASRVRSRIEKVFNYAKGNLRIGPLHRPGIPLRVCGVTRDGTPQIHHNLQTFGHVLGLRLAHPGVEAGKGQQGE